MRLHFFPGTDGVTNFGDELNRWLWPKLAPEVLVRDTRTLFVGIGTLLNDTLPTDVPKAIFGAGVGYGSRVPRVDASWRLYFVRGPRSADALGIPRHRAITDPAILLRLAFERPPGGPAHDAVYVPHWGNAHDGWRRVCEAAGVGYVDPTWPPEKVLAALSSCRLVLAEAMHAAIAADALRVPWVPIQTGANVLRFKWEDWCAAMALDYRPRGWLSNWDTAVRRERTSPKQWLKDRLHLAQVRAAARSGGMLSDEGVFRQRLEACAEMLARLRRDTAVLDSL